ncbi:MAG TPA: hypothetical protein PLX89_01415 [Verrucomicrobiota bacterium]|nr:hypothetical protein [Verrucomicrobiota bacterium]
MNKSFTVGLHHLPTLDTMGFSNLCAKITAIETIYPGTDLRFVFWNIVAPPLPRS